MTMDFEKDLKPFNEQIILSIRNVLCKGWQKLVSHNFPALLSSDNDMHNLY